jgi:hypothetical protein
MYLVLTDYLIEGLETSRETVISSVASMPEHRTIILRFPHPRRKPHSRFAPGLYKATEKVNWNQSLINVLYSKGVFDREFVEKLVRF